MAAEPPVDYQPDHLRDRHNHHTDNTAEHDTGTHHHGAHGQTEANAQREHSGVCQRICDECCEIHTRSGSSCKRPNSRARLTAWVRFTAWNLPISELT